MRSETSTFHTGNLNKLFILLALGLLLTMQKLQACSGISITQTSSPNFILDSNKPCIDGPNASYVSIRVTNTSGSPLINVSLKLDSITLSTAFQLLAPSDSTHYIGTLAPGASFTGFFFIKSACTFNTSAKLNFNLHYNNGSICAYNTTLITKSAISSSAGGVVTSSVTAVSALGSIICDTVSQGFGSVGTNDDIDFQPVSRKTFRADAYELFATKIISSNIPGITAGRKDSLYFKSAGSVNPGNAVIVYYFKVKVPGVSTSAFSFAVTPQGGGNFKYKWDTTAIKAFPVATQSPLITKRASRFYNNPCDTVKYTVTVLNTSSVPISFDRLLDKLPPGATFKRIDASSGVQTLNSSVVPVASDSGTIYFVGGALISSSQYKSYLIPARDSIRAIYWVKLGCNSTIRMDTNTVTGFLDQYPFATAKNLVCVGCAPLAKDALHFHGEYSQDYSFLSWEVPAGRDIHEFKIYRADVTGEYEHIYTEYSSNSGERRHFSEHLGDNVGSRIHYKLEDHNLITGEIKSKEIVLIRNTTEVLPIQVVFENPIQNSLEFRVLQHITNLEVQISSVTGSLIQSFKPQIVDVGQVFNVSTMDLKPGLYYLTIKAANERRIYKIMKL